MPYETLLYQIWHAFFLLIVIMGPLTGLPIFIKITERFDEKRRIHSANRAIKISAILLLFFLFLGERFLDVLGISFEGFQVAGGIVLLLLGITYMFNIDLHKGDKYQTGILVPFATPLIVGPGVITTTILITHWYGYTIAFVAAVLALAVYYTFLRFSTAIVRRIGHQGIEVIARLMGLLLMAIAIDMMRNGVVGFIQIGFGG